MACDYTLLPHEGIRTLIPYVPGKSIEEIAAVFGIKEIIKLASNENPLGCSPLVLNYLASLSAEPILRYPSPKIHALRKKLAEKLHLSAAELILGNGSDPLFGLLLTIFALNQDKHMLTHDYAFSTYAIQARTLGIPVKSLPVHADWTVDIDALIGACTAKTALIFLANPNNPTGLFIPLHQLEKLLEHIPETTILVIDEAYYEYAYPKNHPGALTLLHKFPNVVITRTFSKAYGLAGLRIGYAMAIPEIIGLMERVQLPFVVNQLAMSAAWAALDDNDFLDKTIANNQQGMAFMQRKFQSMGLSYLPSQANFITFDCGQEALPVYEGLLQKGIIVRPLNPYQLPQHLRVSIGTSAQNNYFLDILPQCLTNNKLRK